MKKNILVTGTGGRSIGSGILHALLFSSAEVKNRWHVIATDADPFAWGLYKADQGAVLPPASHPDYIRQVKLLIEKYRIDAVIPGTQIEGDVLLKDRQALAEIPVIANRQELYPLMMDKFATTHTLRELGLPVIETVPLAEWKSITDEFGFPIVVKPTRDTGGSRGLHIVADTRELDSLLPFMDPQAVPCVQPYLGTGENEYTVGILSDKNGTLIDSIVMRRKLMGLSLLQKRTIDQATCAVSTGYSQGYIVKDRRIQSFCEDLAIKLNSVGPLNIQLRVAADQIYVFEIHPRFSGTTPIRADVGFNEVDILLRNFLFDERFGRLDYRSDVAAIRAFQHVIVPINKMESQT